MSEFNAFRPTHVVGPAGQPAWAGPSGTGPPVGRLDPGLDVQVDSVQGEWAHIVCSNGWQAWVERRLLLERSSGPPSPAPFGPLAAPVPPAGGWPAAPAPTAPLAGGAPSGGRRRNLILAGAGLGVVALIVLIVVLVSSSGGPKSTATSGVNSASTPPVTQPQPPTNASPSQSVQVVDSGFTQTKEAPDTTSSTTAPPKAAVTWAVVVRNQSSSLIARSVSFDLTFLDATGKTVATDSGTIETILPGQTAASAYYTDAAGVARMSVGTPTVDKWQMPTQALGSLSATNVFLVPQTDGTNTTDATIASTFTRTLDLEAVAVWYDASNKIIGGDYDPSETVMANGRKNVEVTTAVLTPKVDHVKAFVFIDDSDIAL